MKYKIASVISYSSYHNSFVERVIEEAKKFSNEIIVVASYRFFNGELDKDLKSIVNDDIVFTAYYGLSEPMQDKSSRYWHNYFRKQGFDLIRKKFDAVMFIDSDEVLEGNRVKQWLEEEVEKDQDYKLSHFWYYRDTCYRSRTPEEGAVLVSKSSLNSPKMNWFGEREREDFSKKWNYMASFENKVLGHHYSWAGTKEMLMRKVSSWGHNKDTDWKGMLEEEFSHPFNYTCPFKPYIFDKIEPYIGFTFNE